MQLQNELVVPASVEEAWAVLLDVERVAPCLPGARITGSEDDRWRGTMKVKIGPISASYDGTIEIAEADEQARRAVLRAEARDSRGRGSAAATITSTMEAVADGTKVNVETDLRVTGPAAQFGRGVMQDVSAKMMDRFADCLAAKMGGAEEPPAAPAEPAPPAAAEAAGEPPAAGIPSAAAQPDGVPEPRAAEPTMGRSGDGEEPATPPPAPAAGGPAPPPAPQPDDVLDLGELSRGAVAKRAAPVLVGAAVAFVLVLALRRRGRRR
jgi:uncharacterized protein